MIFPQAFEGPAFTLFLWERDTLRIISNEGEEAIVSVPDFVAFLIHLAAHHAAMLALGGSADRLKAQLALHLVRSHD